MRLVCSFLQQDSKDWSDWADSEAELSLFTISYKFGHIFSFLISQLIL